MKLTKLIAGSALAIALAACNSNREEPATPEPTPASSEPADAVEEPAEAVSILRPEVEAEELPPEPLDSLSVVIGFPEGGDELDEAAIAALEELLASEQMSYPSPILVTGHSDAAGSDRVNVRASRARADAVAQWLIENNIDAQRITVIALGEQNPIEPNALWDGSPNEAGRALNRRAEVLVSAPDL